MTKEWFVMTKKVILITAFVLVFTVLFNSFIFAGNSAIKTPENHFGISPTEIFKVEDTDGDSTTIQGGCYANGCLYVFTRNGDSKNNYGTLICYDAKTHKELSSSTTYVLHGNDMTYCDLMDYFVFATSEFFDENDNFKKKYSNKIYCMTSYGQCLNQVTLGEFITVFGISYDSKNKQYLVAGTKSNGMRVIKKYSVDFNVVSGFEIPYYAEYASDIAQGIDSDGNYIYAAQAKEDNNEGYISVTSLITKEYVCRYSFDTSAIVLFNKELENVSKNQNTLYLGCNVNSTAKDCMMAWSYLRGDVNGDDVIDMLDVLNIRKKLSGENSVNINYLAADANSNGKIDDDDVTVIRKIIAKQPV